MTIQEATHKLYEYYQKRGLIEVNSWMGSIGVGHEKIVIYLNRRPFGKNLDELRSFRDNGYEGYKVEVKVTGPMRLCGSIDSDEDIKREDSLF